ncbi:MAG: hypothetical protein Q8M43_11290 [Sulfuricurvum sp.]|uniref:hypothetical protein n=1 Tax=Sulfuricurvum sp. TaxID=2025608 RepID=UPI00271FB949|nr:hypothetical protein [Sulfuricurvum sp.]MDO9055850.1 hypothetical protein [Sulfuricurvum sp.]MDP3292603.1 hypothetical protein [Sulfuricurvum sp.]
MNELSQFEKLFPTKPSRWALLAMLSTPAAGYFLKDIFILLLPLADDMHKFLLWLVITLSLLLLAAWFIIFDFALLLKDKKHGTIWHHKAE